MPRQIVSLSGNNWRLGRAPSDAVPNLSSWDELDRVQKWLPATVPGNVRADLIRAGDLPDLHFGTAAEAAQWVDEHCWWLVHEFAATLAPSRRTHLVLRGVDYISDSFLNGQHLGRHEGMFSPQIHEVTGPIKSENLLAVRIVGSRWLPRDRSNFWEKLLREGEARLGSLPGRFPARRDTLKCQMGFGWDFAPPVRTMGIWDDLFLVSSEDVFIREVATRQHLVRDSVLVTIQVAVDANRHLTARLRCTLSGETFEAEPLAAERTVQLSPGLGVCSLELIVPQPRLWWPWDHGNPDLYRLSVDIHDGDRLLDSACQNLGLREIEVKDWTLRVNGHLVFARGANWVPVDSLPGRVTDADYSALLTLVHQANINLLRVWGGGLREKRAFYDLCDRLGILVWQEFPFACAFLARHPRSRDYLQLVEAEAKAIVRDLRHHACLALWCGGNEFSPRRNVPLVDVLERTVATEDPGRLFLPASPALGDSHNWQVWHRLQPPCSYRRDEAAFASEFGMQAPPGVPALLRFLPPEDLWPPGPSWAYHGAGIAKLWRYARAFLHDQPPTLESFVEASQRAQARGLQIAIEHFRRRKARGCGGMAIWQFNEPWPAISWSLLDFYREPKPAYEMVKRLYNPVLVSADLVPKQYQPGDLLACNIWLINDRHRSFEGCHLRVTLQNEGGEPQRELVRTLDMSANSAEIVAGLEWQLTAAGGWRLCCELAHRDQSLSSNEYDLTAHDQLLPPSRQRLRNWIARLVIPT